VLFLIGLEICFSTSGDNGKCRLRYSENKLLKITFKLKKENAKILKRWDKFIKHEYIFRTIKTHREVVIYINSLRLNIVKKQTIQRKEFCVASQY
jgi:hypothetical protein